MTHNPADPFDSRTAAEPILERFEFATAGEAPADHARHIESLLDGFNGIDRVEVHPTEERVTVIYDSRRTGPAEIHQHLQDRGYDAARWTKE